MDKPLPIRGLGTQLKAWALEQARAFATTYNATSEDEDDEIAIDELFVNGTHDEGAWIWWDVQDGASFCLAVCIDFTKGTFTVEAR
jgi:hypothetical protein